MLSYLLLIGSHMQKDLIVHEGNISKLGVPMFYVLYGYGSLFDWYFFHVIYIKGCFPYRNELEKYYVTLWTSLIFT